jgi:hypothetical protein
MQSASDWGAVGCGLKFFLQRSLRDFFSVWEVRAIVGFGESAFHEFAMSARQSKQVVPCV